MVEVGELKIEHLLLFVIVGFLLYHLMGKCGCSGNGFSVGYQAETDDNICNEELEKVCPRLSNLTKEACDMCVENNQNQLMRAKCSPGDVKEWCNKLFPCAGKDEKCDINSDCCKPSDPNQFVFCRGGSTPGDPTAHCRWGEHSHPPQ
jgi:hypothetical protein